MAWDVEDVIGSAVASVVGRCLLFAAAVWLGSTLGSAAIVTGRIVETGSWSADDLRWIWLSPLLLLTTWALINIPCLIILLERYLRSDWDGYLLWGIVVALESLMVMAGWLGALVEGWLPALVAWAAWLTLLAMGGTGLWLIRQHFINCWARDLGILRIENSRRNAERASHPLKETESSAGHSPDVL